MFLIVHDLKLGLRRLIKTPVVSATVVAALSVGIGLCALLFGIVDGAILSTLPFENGDRIVRIRRADLSPVSTETYLNWREHQTSFEGLGLAVEHTVNLAIEGRATEPVSTAAVTVPSFALLSVEPILGRRFTDSDTGPNASDVVIISGNLWRVRFGADPDILGRTVRLSGTPVEIIGVMADGFGFPFSQDAWTPQPIDVLRPDGHPDSFIAFGMIRDGVSPDVAAAELNALDERLSRTATEPVPAPIELKKYTNVFNPARLAQVLAGTMMAVAALVLLVACANVTNVLLARAAVRSREVAVRTALGASRARIAMQFWVEVSVLAVGGAVGGAFLAQVAMRVIRDVLATTEGLPFWWDLRLNLPVLALISIAAVGATITAGIVPAMFTSRSNSYGHLKDASRATSSHRIGRTMRRLIGTEIAVSLVLLVVAGLYVRSAVNLMTYDFAFEPDGVYTSIIRTPENRYSTPAARAAFAERLEASLHAIPGASSATVTTKLPSIGSTRRSVAIEGTQLASQTDLPDTDYIAATPGFFSTFRLAAVAGRVYDDRDRAGELPVAVVSASFERLHLPQGAVGRRIALPDETGDPVWITIIGVVPDLSGGELTAPTYDAVYVPFAQAAPARFLIAVRSRTAADTLAAPIREAVASVDQDASPTVMRSLVDAIESANAAYRWFSALFLVAGGSALGLAALGLYGVMAFWVTQRTREIGLRMAIGGGRGNIVSFVLRLGMRPVAFGLAGGMLAALPVAWVFRGTLLNVAPFDPVVFGTVLGVLLCAGWLGCLGPAMKATRVDPQAALAAE